MNTVYTVFRLLRFGFFFAFVALLFGLALTTVARALWPGRFENPLARRRLRYVAAGSVLASLALEAYARVFAPAGGGAFRVPVALERGAVFIAALAGLTFGLARVAASFARAVRRRFAPVSSAVVPESAPPSITRRDALAVVSVTTAVVGYGGLRVARDLDVREIEVHVPDLPPALEGFSLVQLTDIHVGIFTGPRDFAAVLERARALRGDAIVLTGDLLDNNPAHVPDAMRLFSQLHARYGTYAILGNHDYYTDYAAVLAGLHGVGIRALVNDAAVIPGGARDPGLALLGVDDVWAGRVEPGRGPDLDRAIGLAPPDAPRILLAHNPVYFARAAGRVALQLSGHTHGGQFNPGNVLGLGMQYVSGRYVHAGSTLFVSNGLGVTGPPVRLGAPPQLVRIGLTGRARG